MEERSEGPNDRTRRRRRLLAAALVALTASAALVLQGLGTSTVVADGDDEPVSSTTTTALRRSTTSTSTTTTTAPPTSTTAGPTTAPTTTVAPTTTAPPPAPTTTACLPAGGRVPSWGNLTSRYDPATVLDPGDPRPATCPGVLRVLVVGDSTGRGAANGLRRLPGGDLEVWDRTFLGCGMVADTGQCPNWRARWTAAVDEVRPDVVLVYHGVSSDLRPGADPPFLSEEGAQIRRAELAAAMDLLGSRGAAVLWALPAVPLERALFYCGGRRSDTPCDPTWITRWHLDLNDVARTRGVATTDLERFFAGRPGLTAHDRPDGLHMSGPALDAHGAWLADQLRALRR